MGLEQLEDDSGTPSKDDRARSENSEAWSTRQPLIGLNPRRSTLSRCITPPNPRKRLFEVLFSPMAKMAEWLSLHVIRWNQLVVDNPTPRRYTTFLSINQFCAS